MADSRRLANSASPRDSNREYRAADSTGTGTAVSMATIGTLLTALITGFGAAWLLDFSTLQALLIGAIVGIPLAVLVVYKVYA